MIGLSVSPLTVFTLNVLDSNVLLKNLLIKLVTLVELSLTRIFIEPYKVREVLTWLSLSLNVNSPSTFGTNLY